MPAEYAGVLRELGKQGDYKSKVLKVSIPPNRELKPTVDGVALPIPFGFGGWLAFTPGDRGRHVMMGDLVLSEEEVNPIMSEVLRQGLEVTALHNHFFWETPRVFYMHVHGVGEPVEMARKMRGAIDLIGSFKQRIPAVVDQKRVVEIQGVPIDPAALDPIVGHTGDRAGAVYKYIVGRDDLKVKEHGATINARMGLNSWASFFGTAAEAVVAGDVAMQEHELQPVLRSLRANGLEVVAIHHHMTGSRPMFIFLHYWGKGPSEKLARGFREALNQLASKSKPPRH
jgi:hypothetical protein